MRSPAQWGFRIWGVWGLQLISLTSLKTWGSSSLSQLLTSEFERSGSTGSCCKISIDMVEDCCWLAGSSKDLQLWSDLQCFETLMMQAFYRRCCMQQGKEKDQQNGRCVWFLLTPFPQLPQFIELWINLLPLFELCRTSGCKTPEVKTLFCLHLFSTKLFVVRVEGFLVGCITVVCSVAEVFGLVALQFRRSLIT